MKSEGALRTFTVAGFVLVSALTPGFFNKLGTERRHPVPLVGKTRSDGAIVLTGGPAVFPGTTVVTGVRVEGLPWLPPGSLPVARDITSLPTNTAVAYQLLAPDMSKMKASARRPWASRYSLVRSSEGKMLLVAPSSAPMLPIVSRSVAERVATPGP